MTIEFLKVGYFRDFQVLNFNKIKWSIKFIIFSVLFLIDPVSIKQARSNPSYQITIESDSQLLDDKSSNFEAYGNVNITIQSKNINSNSQEVKYFPLENILIFNRDVHLNQNEYNSIKSDRFIFNTLTGDWFADSDKESFVQSKFFLNYPNNIDSDN